MKHENKKTLELLNNNFRLLQESLYALSLSVKKVKTILPKKEYSFEEMESFDSLTSRFSRSADIYTQKVLRTIWMLLHEPYDPFIDMMNKAEKMHLIESADVLIEIRDLRNQITHEYIPEAIQQLVPEVIRLASQLEENVEYTQRFMEERGWNI